MNALTNRSRIFTQTHVIARHKTAQVYATSSRGFQRELPPTRQTRPALRQRRHSVDVVTVDYWPRELCGWPDEEDVAVPSMPIQFEPAQRRCLELDEPIQREPVAAFPVARRYRMLDRAQNHHYPPAYGPHADDTYLELPKSSLSNRDARTITALSLPDGWFADNILDVALELISLEIDAESHEICIANSLMAQCLFIPGLGDSDGNNYAGMAEYKKMFENKKWIFIPINDGILEKDATSTQGAHWSFIAVNRRDRVAHYVDSLFSKNWKYQDLAGTIATGLGNILGEEYDFRVEYHAPDQWAHNSYDDSRGWDMGPCGPFVVTMINLYVQEIIRVRNAGLEDALSLRIGDGYGEIFRHLFDSFRVRCNIVERLARLKIKLEADRLTSQHDAIVLAGLGDSVEVIDDQQPLFDDLVQVLEEDAATSGTESAASPIREDDFESDDLEDEWRNGEPQSDTRAKYDSPEDVVISSSPYDPAKDAGDPRDDYILKQDGVVHRSGSDHHLRRTSGVQIDGDIMATDDEEFAVEINLSPTESPVY